MAFPDFLLFISHEEGVVNNAAVCTFSEATPTGWGVPNACLLTMCCTLILPAESMVLLTRWVWSFDDVRCFLQNYRKWGSSIMTFQKKMQVV